MDSISAFRVGHPDATALREFREKHFTSVYEQNYQKIYRICQRYSSKLEDAMDLAHDVFVLYFQNFENFRHESSPSTWMYKVAINLGIQRWRRSRLRYLDSNELDCMDVPTHDTEKMMLDKITVGKILDRCPIRTRKILSLFHIERMTQSEIGEMLGISRATVTRHLVYVKQFRLPVRCEKSGWEKTAAGEGLVEKGLVKRPAKSLVNGCVKGPRKGPGVTPNWLSGKAPTTR